MKRLFNKRIIYVITCIVLACVLFSACAKFKNLFGKNSQNSETLSPTAVSSATPGSETVTPVPTKDNVLKILPTETPKASPSVNEDDKIDDIQIIDDLFGTNVPISTELSNATPDQNGVVSGTAQPVSSQGASATQDLTKTAAPTAAVKSSATPKATQNSGSSFSPGHNVAIVTPTPIVHKSHVVSTPQPSPLPSGGISKDKCSMADYSKQALPSEQYKTEVTTILSSLAAGNPSSFTQGTSADIMAFLYSHRYLLGTTRITMLGYKNSSNYTISATFKQPEQESKSQYLATLAWADSVIAKLKINKNTLQKDAISKINSYLADFLTYDYDAYYDYLAGSGYNVDENVYVSIQTGIGVCEHYAQLFQLLCHKCGISAYYEANSNQYHAYNYVVFSDGAKYYVDATWNDAIETTKFNINGVQYEDVYAAADGLWAGKPDTTYKKFSSGLHCDKQGFIDYYCNFYLSRYLLLPRDQFIEIHRNWSESDDYYNYEKHES